MPLPLSAECSGFNYSSRSSGQNPTSKCLLQFSDEFLAPTDDISKWLKKQRSRSFRTIQYRKQRGGVGHEFILLLLHPYYSDVVDCYCRVERFGDPEHLAQVAFLDGAIAKDYIQAIPCSSSDPKPEILIDNSDIVAEITFPQIFTLRDVLAICYGISKHFRAKRYTLQQYNCYFFSWTVMLALARACIDWDVSPSIPEHVNNMRHHITKSIYEQGPARFRSVAYILSDNTPTGYENEEEHPLDQAISSQLSGSGFFNLVTLALQRLFWEDRLPTKLADAMAGELSELASRSIDLTAIKEMKSGGLNNPTLQDKHHVDFKYALARLTRKAALMASESSLGPVPRILATASPTLVVVKQRLGHEVWCKELAKCFLHPSRLASTNSDNEEIQTCNQPNHHGCRLIKSPIRDLCFGPASAVLDFSARFMFTCLFTLTGVLSNVEADLGDYGTPKKNPFHRVALGLKATARSGAIEIRRIPKSYAFSKHLLLLAIGEIATRKLDSVANEQLKQLFINGETDVALARINHPSLKLFDCGLRALLEDNTVYQLNRQILRPCVTFNITTILKTVQPCLRDWQLDWRLILQQHFLDTMVGAAKGDLTDLIGRANMKDVFQVIGNYDNGQFQMGQLDHICQRGASLPKISNTLSKCSVGPENNPNWWSYQVLQQFIRQRISHLSKRETSFAPYLKHIPFAKPSELCQKEIEVTMEDIWQASSSLIKTRPHTLMVTMV